jgi:hypothetical protein
MLRTQYNKSLAATIELSPTSALFEEPGPGVRALLGVLVFFPQVVKALSLRPAFPYSLNNRCFLFVSSTRAHRFIFIFLPLVVGYLPPALCINLTVECNRQSATLSGYPRILRSPCLQTPSSIMHLFVHHLGRSPDPVASDHEHCIHSSPVSRERS